MFLCGDVLYIQIKKWYVKFGATGSLKIEANKIEIIMDVIAMPAKYSSISVFYA